MSIEHFSFTIPEKVWKDDPLGCRNFIRDIKKTISRSNRNYTKDSHVWTVKTKYVEEVKNLANWHIGGKIDLLESSPQQ